MIRIAIATIFGGVALVIAPAAATITCQSSAPRGIAASYRIIDGRKCWYAGRHHVAKSRLAWRRVARTPSLKRKPVVPAAEIGTIEITGSVDPAFETRWQTLAPVVWARAEARR